MFLFSISCFTSREYRKNINSISSKFVGVSWDKKKKKWVSQIKIGSKKIKIGRFNTEIEASNAYQNRLKEIL